MFSFPIFNLQFDLHDILYYYIVDDQLCRIYLLQETFESPKNFIR